MGNKENESYFTYKRAEQEETLKKVEENYKLLWNMWKKYGRMGEKRKVGFKMLLNVQRKLYGYKENKRTRGEGKWNFYQSRKR